MKYQVWVIARDPKTLHPIAEVLVFENEDRLKADRYNESYPRTSDNARFLFGPVVLGQCPIYSTETRIPGWGAVVAMQYAPGDPDRQGQAKIIGGGGYSGAGGAGGPASSFNGAGGSVGGAGSGGGKACAHCGAANSLLNTRCYRGGRPL